MIIKVTAGAKVKGRPRQKDRPQEDVSIDDEPEFEVGAVVYARDGTEFYKGKVVSVKGRRCKLHYLGFSTRYDEWRDDRTVFRQDPDMKQVVPDTGAASGSAPTKAATSRGRGRPPKSKAGAGTADASAPSHPATARSTGRGRPRSAATGGGAADSMPPAGAPAKRGRGRPKKTEAGVGVAGHSDSAAAAAAPARRPGRPRKSETRTGTAGAPDPGTPAAQAAVPKDKSETGAGPADAANASCHPSAKALPPPPLAPALVPATGTPGLSLPVEPAPACNGPALAVTHPTAATRKQRGAAGPRQPAATSAAPAAAGPEARAGPKARRGQRDGCSKPPLALRGVLRQPEHDRDQPWPVLHGHGPTCGRYSGEQLANVLTERGFLCYEEDNSVFVLIGSGHGGGKDRRDQLAHVRLLAKER